jgi:ribosomal protein S18 acetylase RimI-like enzyme
MATIRQIQPTEAAEFRAIRLRAITDSPFAFGSTLAETEARPMEYWVNRVTSAAAGEATILYVAEDSSGWVGLVGGFLVDSDRARGVDLVSMWVDPACRGQGIGQHLVERIADWSRRRGAARVVLWVTETNQPAISLYSRCGFRATGEFQPLPSNPALRELEMVLPL